MTIEAGDKAPDFTLATDGNGTVSLKKLRGKTVILYFYPRADTPGCTTESCGFRDTKSRFDAAEAVILGVSPDTVEAQLAFAEKFTLPFQLLADHEHQVAEAYGVWVEKNNYGKKYFGIARTTFLIGPDGRIRHLFR